MPHSPTQESPSPLSHATAPPGTSSSAHRDHSALPGVSPLLLAKRREHDDADVRRPSIQFLPTQGQQPTGNPRAVKSKQVRRMSSPPPPPVFRPRVSFDTFDKPADFIEENSFTLVKKHKDYEYTKRSRTFLCGLDANDYSEYALEWLIDELVDDGDEIVCLRVVEKDASIAGDSSLDSGRYREEARQLMEHIQTRNTENKAINLILEFSVGKVNKVIAEMINLYEPAILIVGTRGRSLGGFQGLLPGSVSKYCLQHSPVPVIVVRPNSKRTRTKMKRMKDPSRHGYRDILDKADPLGGHVLDHSHRKSLVDDAPPVSDAEAAAVAAAIGYKPGTIDSSPLAQVTLTEDRRSFDNAGDSSPEDVRSVGVVMKSPELRDLDSPLPSDISSDDDNSDMERDIVSHEHTAGDKASRRQERRRRSVDAATSGIEAMSLPEDQEGRTFMKASTQ